MELPVLQILLMGFLGLLISTVVGSAAVRTGFSIPSQNNHQLSINGLRGYLALAVAIHHFSIWLSYARGGVPWALPNSAPLASLGSTSVALFFMITGFVFYPKIIDPRSASWPALYITRVFRIVPLICFCVAMVCLIILYRQAGYSKGAFVLPIAQWVSTVGEPPIFGYPNSKFINANVLWSLKCEWIFYLLVLPICAGCGLVLRNNRTWTIPLVLLVVSLLARLPYNGHGFLLFLPLFSVGMLAFEIQKIQRLRQIFGSYWFGILAVAIAVAASSAGLSPTSEFKQGALAIFFLSVACGNSVFGVLRTKGAQALGEVSYSIYIMHGLILSIVFVDFRALRWLPLNQIPIMLIIGLPMIAMISFATFLLIEKPFLTFGKSLARRITGGRPKLSAAQLEVAP